MTTNNSYTTQVVETQNPTPHYYQILAFNHQDDIDYNCSSHIYPSYVSCMLRTGFYTPFSVEEMRGEPLMLQSNFADGLCFTETEFIPEVVLLAKKTWPKKEFHIVEMDALCFGRRRPRWVVKSFNKERKQ